MNSKIYWKLNELWSHPTWTILNKTPIETLGITITDNDQANFNIISNKEY